MRSYTLLYSKIWKQVVAMIAVPILTIIPFILILTLYQDLSDTIVFIAIFAFMGVMILLTLYVVFRQAMVAVAITINDSAIEIYFKNKTIFNWIRKKEILLSDVEFVSDDEDVAHNSRRFFTIKSRKETGKIILLAPRNMSPGEGEAFSLELNTAVENFNQQGITANSPIRQVSFFTGGFAKILTICFIIIMVIATIIKIIDPSKIEWYKLVWMYVLAASWFANVFIAKRKS